jgi:sulfur-carrier protein
MLTLRFFARIREQLGTAQLQWPLAADVNTLVAVLSEQRGSAWGEILSASNVIVAINQEVAGRGQVLHDGDEVAFFPPVTGG